MTRLKSTLVALSLLTASPVFAQTNVTGDWDVTVTSPQGTNTTPVSFKQDGAKVSGVFKSPQGTLPFDGGTMTGDDLKFTFTIHPRPHDRPHRRLPLRVSDRSGLVAQWSQRSGARRGARRPSGRSASG